MPITGESAKMAATTSRLTSIQRVDPVLIPPESAACRMQAVQWRRVVIVVEWTNEREAWRVGLGRGQE